MSEYQYYEFQAIDRPLTEEDRDMLRALSSRGRVTATSFTNTYNHGDFRGDPVKLMERYFDLHLYLANWGAHRLMIRLPKRLIDTGMLDACARELDEVSVRDAGENLILDINRGEIDAEDGDWSEEGDEGPGWLAGLAPLRADVLGGDQRLFYLLWLMAVENETFPEDTPEPLPGLGPLTGALETFARFFDIDPDLVQAAAKRSAAVAIDPAAAGAIIAGMEDAGKTAWLTRLWDNDPHTGTELRREIGRRLAAMGETRPEAPRRTVGELLARAQEIGAERERAEEKREAAEQARRAREAEGARQKRLTTIRQRGEYVWRDVETEIEYRNASSYDKATVLLRDLREVAEQQGTLADFKRRLAAIREQHVRKGRFLDRIADL